MHLKTLTLRGFKSFASATTLRFEPGITCVVGPNGSGKSNVVDALSWVMGEQGVKSLRGGKMEDVIFAGTSGRPPLGRAEVVLTIDNTDGALPIDYSEVTIARTMFRHGGSEYAINGHPARLLDVQELLSDSGIGREMHVIVGQGQLDAILQATPEIRRSFIEEAAGVLKHRKRKEKALRKLEACEGNLTRLADLSAEIRRQLKPLGRQAEAARKAARIQAEVRDASARLLADDLVQAMLVRDSDLAGSEQTRQRRQEVEHRLAEARDLERTAAHDLTTAGPALSAAQHNWSSLAALRERVLGTHRVAVDRFAGASRDPGPVLSGRDPDALDAEAAAVTAQEQALRAEAVDRAAALGAAEQARTRAEAAFQAEQERVAAAARAAADRREGLARLAGQVQARRSRADAEQTEIDRLTAARAQAQARAAQARREFGAAESRVVDLDAGEVDLDADHERAVSALAEAEEALTAWQREESALSERRAAGQARVEGLEVGLARRDAAHTLLAAGDALPGGVRAVAALLEVEPSYERAVAAALGPVAEAVAAPGLDAAVRALEYLRQTDGGRAAVVPTGGPDDPSEGARPIVTAAAGESPAPEGTRWAIDLVRAPADLAPALRPALAGVLVVPDLALARTVVAARPDLVAVTHDGDRLGRWLVAGGSSGDPGRLELQAATEAARDELRAVEHHLERHRFARADLLGRRDVAARAVEVTLTQLHSSDAELAAVAEDLGRLSAAVQAAEEEAERLLSAIVVAEAARDADLTALRDLQERVRRAETAAEAVDEPHPGERDRLAELARAARESETQARLALLSVEERVRGLSGRADGLRRAARQERQARVEAARHREAMATQASVAAAVRDASRLLAHCVEQTQQRAAAERRAAEQEQAEAATRLRSARDRLEGLNRELEALVDAAHAEDLVRAEHEREVEGLRGRSLAEFGVDGDALIAEYGPDRGVPVDGEDSSEVPYVRQHQLRRLREAERGLALLGTVNPLALEEFAALEERHQFLGEQVEDLRRTRHDLAGIVADVDRRVEQVFAQAYEDVEQAFARVFARLFPGGEGRLVLTEPDNWLATGVDVEARPAGKKVKRLSLLSGGERSLVAVAFLVSLFIARPSPFYILDEVEAALDDANLGRLLEIYEELRADSQLLVITHQKRTMEIADALYGVSMRGDGVSTVISQRLRGAESVA